MSIHRVAGCNCSKQLATATAAYFLLGLSPQGHWVIRETTGRKGGLFRTRAAAIKYAREESQGGNFTILFQPDGMEFELQLIKRAA